LHGHRTFAARGAKRARICAAPGLHLPGPSSHESGVLSDTDLAHVAGPFDAVLLDTFASADTLARMLEHARRLLTPGDGYGSSSPMNRWRGRASASWNIRWRAAPACWAMPA